MRRKFLFGMLGSAMLFGCKSKDAADTKPHVETGVFLVEDGHISAEELDAVPPTTMPPSPTATPPAGWVMIWRDAKDHRLFCKDSAGNRCLPPVEDKR